MGKTYLLGYVAANVRSMTSFTRTDRLGDHFTPRALREFVEGSAPEGFDLSDYTGLSSEAMLERILEHRKWRHHHGIDELASRSDLYVAYVRRVEEMLAMIHDALVRHDLLDRLGSTSIVDLAAAEGFVTTRFVDWGATKVDAVELNAGNLDRLALIWHYLNYHDRAELNLSRMDFEQAGWGFNMPQSYSFVLALGIIYHLENPLLFARNLYEITDDVCIVESDTPTFADPKRFRGNGVVYLNKDQVTIEAGDVRKLIEFRPDREALIDIMLTSGFQSVEVLEPKPEANATFYATGEKSVLLCRK